MSPTLDLVLRVATFTLIVAAAFAALAAVLFGALGIARLFRRKGRTS